MLTRKKYIQIGLISLILALILVNFTATMTETLIHNVYWLGQGNTSSQIEIEVDGSGIPIVDYHYQNQHYIGKQRNPITISQKALEYYEEYEAGENRSRELFLNCSDWLADNIKLQDDWGIYEYTFPFDRYTMTPPWNSGMAQGHALQVLWRAHKITHNENYLNVSQAVLNSFFIDAENGGATYKTSDGGWWYEEYADVGGEEPWVLNGMMFTVLGIYEYYSYTANPEAMYLFDQGVVSLKNHLSDYDNNGDSFYDRLKTPASPNYHEIHIDQLDQLYTITGEKIFKEYHDKWNTFKQYPFIVQFLLKPTLMRLLIVGTNIVILLSLSGGAIVFYRLKKQG